MIIRRFRLERICKWERYIPPPLVQDSRHCLERLHKTKLLGFPRNTGTRGTCHSGASIVSNVLELNNVYEGQIVATMKTSIQGIRG